MGAAIGLHLLLSQELARRMGRGNVLGLQAPASAALPAKPAWLWPPGAQRSLPARPHGLQRPGPVWDAACSGLRLCLGLLSPLALFGGRPAWPRGRRQQASPVFLAVSLTSCFGTLSFGAVFLPSCTSIWTGMRGEFPATSQPESGTLPCDCSPAPGHETQSWSWASHLPSLCLS